MADIHHGKHHLLRLEMLVLIVLVFIGGFAGGFLTARLKYKADLLVTRLLVGETVEEITLSQQMLAINSLDGGAMMRNDQMYRVEGERISVMKDSFRLTDATRINVDGSVIRSDGITFKLINGQGIKADGDLILVDPTVAQ